MDNKENNLLKKGLEYRLEELNIERYRNLLKELDLVIEILKYYKLLDNNHIEYNKEEYKEVLERFKNLQEEKKRLDSKVKTKREGIEER